MRKSALAAVVAAALACSRPEPVPAPPPGPAPAAPSASASPVASAMPAPSGPACASAAPCTMQAWMEEAFAGPLDAHDSRSLVTALERAAFVAPPGYANWASIARDGADAARVDDLDAVKASCRGCHAQYRDRYAKELRDKKI